EARSSARGSPPPQGRRPFRFGRLVDDAEPYQRRIGRTLPRCPSATDGAPHGFVSCFAGEEDTVAHWFGKRGARPLAARGGGREGTERPGLVVPPGCARASDGFPDISAVQACEPVQCERYHGRLARSREVGAKLSGDFDRAQHGAGDVTQNGGGAS